MGSMYLVDASRKPGRPSDAPERLRDAYDALIAEGNTAPYLKEIAERAGLSVMAASTHLNHNPSGSPLLEGIWGPEQRQAAHRRRMQEDVNPRRRGIGNANQAAEGYPNLVAARAVRTRRLEEQRRAREQAEQTA